MVTDREILEIVHGISGRHDEAILFGIANGIKKHHVEALRNVFGISEPTRTISDSEVGCIVNKYRKGKNASTIALETNVSTKTVYRALKKMKPRKRWFWSSDDDDRLLSMMDGKVGIDKMCDSLGRSRASVYNRITFLNKRKDGD